MEVLIEAIEHESDPTSSGEEEEEELEEGEEPQEEEEEAETNKIGEKEEGEENSGKNNRRMRQALKNIPRKGMNLQECVLNPQRRRKLLS